MNSSPITGFCCITNVCNKSKKEFVGFLILHTHTHTTVQLFDELSVVINTTVHRPGNAYLILDSALPCYVILALDMAGLVKLWCRGGGGGEYFFSIR